MDGVMISSNDRMVVKPNILTKPRKGQVVRGVGGSGCSEARA